MKTAASYPIIVLYAGFCLLIFWCCRVQAQGCLNADFSSGGFQYWSGTYSKDQCLGSDSNGRCNCSPTNPYYSLGLNRGPNNDPVNDAVNEYNQVITTSAGGNDVNLAGFGFSLPVVFPGNAYSARIGNMWQQIVGGGSGDGESLSYTYTVNASNCNFIYHYAAVLYSGPHTPGQQSYFNISMVANGTDTVACAAYEVDATTAKTIGGFNNIGDSIFWKPWSSVVVPLFNYIGQKVTITFTTRGCIPNGCAGKHYAYAYLAAECTSSALTASNGFTCGTFDTLTAPAGSATYRWTGPGILGSDSSQQIIVNQPGTYVVNMTTFGNVACAFSMDTVIKGAYPQPNFEAPLVCVGDSVRFKDLSGPVGGISSWQWDFGDGDSSNLQNPSHTFAATGTYAVKLTIVTGPCTGDTTIIVQVHEQPTATFTAPSPVCIYTNSHIIYTGNAPNYYTFTWNFDGGTGRPLTGQGPLNISWLTAGTKTIVLQVTAGACFSAPDTELVTVKPYLGMQLATYTSICQGKSATLTALNCTSYEWSQGSSLNDSTSGTVIATPLATTTYSVTGSDSECLSVDTVTVAVYNYPGTSFTVSGPVCIGQNANVTYTGNGGNASIYNWDFHGGAASADSGAGPFTVNWLKPGTHQVTLNISESGCDTTATDTVSVTDNPPHPALTADTFIACTGAQVCFTSAAVGDNIGYIWNFGDGDTSQAQSPCHVYTLSGNYTVMFRVALSPECIFDTTLDNLITIVPNALADFTPSATEIQLPETLISFTNQSQHAYNYLWNFVLAGDSNSSVGTSGDTNTFFNFINYGKYNVILIAYNQLGCADTTSQTVVVLPEQNYFIPNVFSPNGDGVNDYFFVYMQAGATLLSFEVFDRWGEKVHDGTYPWDGTYKGKPSPVGVYTYVITIQLVAGQNEVLRTGSVTLLR